MARNRKNLKNEGKHHTSPDPLIEAKLGSTVVHIAQPSAQQLASGLADSRRALKALPSAIAALPSSLKLKFKDDTPVFWADPADPTVVMRKLSRRISRGKFVNGRFVELK